jgi:hypothetical protein
MKLLVAIFLFLLADASEFPDVTRIRNLYDDALYNKDKAEELISYLDTTKHTPLAIGYKGSATMLLAKHSRNPLRKYKYFNEGKALLEEAISKDSASAELRYLRFSVQTNSPSFLGYNNSIQRDKLFLLESVKNISEPDLKKNILSILKNSKYVNENEKQKI